MACQGCMFMGVAERVMSADGLLLVFPYCISHAFLHPANVAGVPIKAQMWSEPPYLMHVKWSVCCA